MNLLEKVAEILKLNGGKKEGEVVVSISELTRLMVEAHESKKEVEKIKSELKETKDELSKTLEDNKYYCDRHIEILKELEETNRKLKAEKKISKRLRDKLDSCETARDIYKGRYQASVLTEPRKVDIYG